MTLHRVDTRNEIILNGVRYKTVGPVAQSLVAFPEKLVIGDFTTETHPTHSVWAPTFTGGIGKSKVTPREVSNRAWWATCQLRHNRQVVPLQLATTTAASGITGSFVIGAIGELANEIYVAHGTDVRKYSNTSDGWGSSLATLPAGASDVITVRLSGTVYMVFATTTGITYTSDGVTFTDNGQDAQYLAFWDDRLWGITTTGQLWYSYNLSVFSNDAQLPLPDDYVNDLFVARNAAGAMVLFAATQDGLWVHDNDFTRWRPTELELPTSPDNGVGATRWRDSTYIPSGLAIYRFIQGENSAIVTPMGLDMDDGLPSNQRGVIRQLLGSHNDLLAVLDSTSAPAVQNTHITAGIGSHHSMSVPINVGYSSILGWNEAAWECKWLGASTTESITAAKVSNAYSTYRLWWAQGTRVLYMPLQRDIQNPEEVTTLTFASTAELITPWLEPDKDVDSTASQIRVDVSGASSTETIIVAYATNYGTTYTDLVPTISANGITEFSLPSSTDLSGLAFRAVRLRFTFARGSTTTNRAVLRSVVLIFRKKLTPKYKFEVTVDLNNIWRQNTPRQMKASLRAAVASVNFVPFSYRNDTATDLGSTDRRYWVDVISATNIEETGEDERGNSTLIMEQA